jgi:phage tail protein X
MIYRTKDGDVLDALCLTHYGARAGATELVLDANPGLGQRGPVYPSGILITFPDLPSEAPEAATIKLWN